MKTLRLAGVTTALLAAAGLCSAQLAPQIVEIESAAQPLSQVLSEARWRFGAGAPAGSVIPEHVSHAERCLRPLLSRVRERAPQMSALERAELAASSPQLAIAVRNGLRLSSDTALAELGSQLAAAASAEGGSQLPLMPELELTMEGKECIVHYTLTGENAAPDELYVKTIQKSVDKAAKKLIKAFRRPFYEPAEDGIDKLHVFVGNLDLDPDLADALAAVTDVQDAPEPGGIKAQTVYMSVDTGIREYATSVNQSWQKVVAATATHEFMHCVQSAYNAFFSRWVVEGQATWAELAVGKSKEGVRDFLKTELSIFNSPELPLWHDSIHQYSTAPIFFYLDFFAGKGSNKAYLELSPNTNDGLDILEQVLFQNDFSFFSDFYPPYLARLYQKKIKGLPKSIVPDFSVTETGVNQYGWQASGEVLPTAVQIYEFQAPAGLKTDLLFARVGAGTTAIIGNSSADGVLLHSKNKRLVLHQSFAETINKFRGKAKAVLIVTDWDYDGPTKQAAAFTAEVVVPFLDVKNVQTNSPVPQAGTVELTFTYDLLGVPAGLNQFTVLLFHTIKSPKTPKQQSFLTRVWDVGVGQQHTEMFQLSQPGTHKLHYTARTPPDNFSFSGEHVNDKVNLKVKVLKP